MAGLLVRDECRAAQSKDAVLDASSYVRGLHLLSLQHQLGHTNRVRCCNRAKTFIAMGWNGTIATFVLFRSRLPIAPFASSSQSPRAVHDEAYDMCLAFWDFGTKNGSLEKLWDY